MSVFQRHLFPNGLRLITVEMPHLHSAEMHCFVGVGSRHEKEEEGGISHFLEHMLFRGTADYPDSQRLEQAFEAIGGVVNASTDAESTCYHSRFHPRELAACAGLFASMLRRPLLRELDIERRIITEEALEDYNEHGEEINPDNLTSRLLWPGHPLSQPTIGTCESLQRITRTRLQHHYRDYYTPHNTVITVAGAVLHSEVRQVIETVFGDWQGGPPPTTLMWNGPPQGNAGATAAWVHDSDSQTAIQLALLLPGRYDLRQMNFRVLRRLLSGSGSARLPHRLREELGLTYSIEANLSLFADSGCLSIDLAVTPENLSRAVAEVLEVLADLRRGPVTADELERVTRSYRYDLEFSRDHPDDMAIRHGWGELAGCLRTIEDDARELATVSPQSLWEATRSLFAPERLKLAVVGPFAAAEKERTMQGFNAFLHQD